MGIIGTDQGPDPCTVPALQSPRPFLAPELLERRYDAVSTVFCTQYSKKDWHARLGGGAHADAIMDRIVHNTLWITTGEMNMREHIAHTTS